MNKIKKSIISILLAGIILAPCSCKKTKKYIVVWSNWNGDILEIDSNVKEGTLPIYDGIEPSREEDNEYIYTWDGWSPEVVAATGDVVYTAKFSREMHEHIWNEPTYVWSADYSSCYAERVCSLCGNHVETETAESVYTVVNAPTHEEDGLGKYTATFENSGFQSVEHEVLIPVLTQWEVTKEEFDNYFKTRKAYENLITANYRFSFMTTQQTCDAENPSITCFCYSEISTIDIDNGKIKQTRTFIDDVGHVVNDDVIYYELDTEFALSGIIPYTAYNYNYNDDIWVTTHKESYLPFIGIVASTNNQYDNLVYNSENKYYDFDASEVFATNDSNIIRIGFENGKLKYASQVYTFNREMPVITTKCIYNFRNYGSVSVTLPTV